MGDDDDDDDLCERTSSRSGSLMCDKIGQLWGNPDCVNNNTDRSPENKCEACQQLKDVRS